MNLFVFDEDPGVCARYLDDNRLELAGRYSYSVLCAVLQSHGEGRLLMASRMDHDVKKWAAENQENLWWTYWYHISLMSEYRRRSGSRHSCDNQIRDTTVERVCRNLMRSRSSMKFFNKAASFKKKIDVRFIPDVHLAYKTYLRQLHAIDKSEPTWYGISRKWSEVEYYAQSGHMNNHNVSIEASGEYHISFRPERQQPGRVVADWYNENAMVEVPLTASSLEGAQLRSGGLNIIEPNDNLRGMSTQNIIMDDAGFVQMDWVNQVTGEELAERTANTVARQLRRDDITTVMGEGVTQEMIDSLYNRLTRT